MKIEKTPITGLVVIYPTIFKDGRGYFYESFNKKKFCELIGLDDVNFVQDNQSKSNKGVLRGLHFQNPPYAQGKLVRVINGAVLDVVVDIRSNSDTYGQHFMIELNEENKTQLWIPEGFAHGFLTLEDNTVFNYKCTNYYHKESEDSIIWNDSDIGIDWNIQTPILSQKDQVGKKISNFVSKF